MISLRRAHLTCHDSGVEGTVSVSSLLLYPYKGCMTDPRQRGDEAIGETLKPRGRRGRCARNVAKKERREDYLE